MPDSCKHRLIHSTLALVGNGYAIGHLMMWPLKAVWSGHARFISRLLICLLTSTSAPVLAGATISLAWDPSSDATVAGYKIYYGTTSHGYTTAVDVGNVLNANITGLINNTTYYFAATTYTSSGVESDFSNEATFLAQSVTTPPPVYLPPTLDALGNIVINESAGLQTVNLTGVSLGSGQTLTITAVSSNPALIPNPAVNYMSPNSAGILTFTPTQFANGTATITVTANNGLAQSNIVTRTFTVSVAAVNQAPTLNPIANVGLNYSSSATTSVGLTGISSGAANENQKLTVTAVSSNPQLVPNPTVTYASPNTTGSLGLKTAANASGTASITVTVNDGGASNNLVTQTFTVTVTPVYQPPTLNALANVSINQNASQQTVNLSGIGLGSGQNLNVSAISSNPSLIPNPTVNYISPSSTGSLNFTPVTNANGTATITVTADNGQPQNNLVTSTFTVNVAAVNQPPTLDPASNLIISQNAGLQTVNLTGISLGSGQTLSITAVSSNPSLIPNPAINYTSPANTGTLTFAPAQSATGTATITVTANNGLAPNNIVTRTFTVTVATVNPPPTLNPIGNIPLNYSVNTQTIGLSGISSGSANANQKLTVTAVSSNPQLIPNPTVTYTSPNTTGSLSLKTATNASGTALITVTVNDGAVINNLTTQTFTVYVTAFYQPPTLNALGDVSLNQNAGLQTVNLSGIGLGSGQNLTITAVSSDPSVVPDPAVSYISPASTGSLNFTPVANATGPATITVTVNNGQPQNNLVTRTFTVNVANSSQSTIYQSPTLDPINNLTVDYTSAGKKAALTGIAPGTKGTQKIKITAVSNNPGVVPNPTVSYFSPQPSGTLNVKPAPGTNGMATITVTVNDGGPSNNIIVRTFDVTVAPNQPPTLDAISDLTLAYNSAAQKINLSGITPGAFDEIQKLKITAISSNPKLIPNLKVSYKTPLTDGSLSFKPATGTNGTALITVIVNDGGKANNLTTRTFTVTILPAAPAQSALAAAAATLSSSISAAGKFSLNVNGANGYKFVVQASTDLINWVNVNTNTSPFTFVDEQSTQFDKRYYRTVYTAP